MKGGVEDLALTRISLSQNVLRKGVVVGVPFEPCVEDLLSLLLVQ